MKFSSNLSQHSIIPVSEYQYVVWGRNDRGQTGNGTQTNITTPELITLDFQFKKIASGGFHTMFLDYDNCVHGVGSNTFGQLGIGEKPLLQFHPVLIPIENVVDIFCGWLNSFAITEDGSLWTWGKNDKAQLGIGVDPPVVYNPVRVDIEDIIDVYCCKNHTMVMNKDGEIFGCGSNSYGELGIGNREDQFNWVKIPLFDVQHIVCQDTYTMVLKNDRTIWAFGNNEKYELGLGHNEESIQTPQLVPLENVIQISSGKGYSLALTSDHKIYSWGSGSFGKLGHGDKLNQEVPKEITSLSNIIYVQCGYKQSYALNKNGDYYGWGYNETGYIGLGNKNNQFLPALIKNFELSYLFYKSNNYVDYVSELFQSTDGDIEIVVDGSHEYIHSLLIKARCPNFLENLDYFDSLPGSIYKLFLHFLLYDSIILSELKSLDDPTKYIFLTWKTGIDLGIPRFSLCALNWVTANEGRIDIIEYLNYVNNDHNEFQFDPSLRVLLNEHDHSPGNQEDLYELTKLYSNYHEIEDSSTYQEDFDKIFLDKEFSDFTLTVTDRVGEVKEFKCHKLILSYSSEYFNMLNRRSQLTQNHQTSLYMDTFSKMIGYFYQEKIEWDITDCVFFLINQNMYLFDESLMKYFHRRIKKISEEEEIQVKNLLRKLDSSELEFLCNRDETRQTKLKFLIENEYSNIHFFHSIISTSSLVKGILRSIEETNYNQEHIEDKVEYLNQKIDLVDQNLSEVNRKVDNIEGKLDLILSYLQNTTH
eukprot:TRINITY_DN10260_c0_g1_i1.p1 TRINITY_DN10260_c0_g1~~TRINITY_DN10260_c0_g1_i1.p1  ORF type:complete len:759 (+),score=125.13 TRINITY_DN10260_c0_g1_i1:1-2277(+)